MLIILALVAWSATSVASVMSETVMQSTNDLATFNTSDKESNYFGDNSERTILIKDILQSFRPTMFEGLNVQELEEKRQLIVNIESNLSGRVYHRRLFNTVMWVHVLNDLKKLFKEDDVVEKAIYEIFAQKLRDDYEFANALVPVPKHRRPLQLAAKLLKLQVMKWLDSKQNAAQIYDLLHLQEQTGNPFNKPVFLQWVNFMDAKYTKSNYKMQMYNFLAQKFEGDDLTRLFVEAKPTVHTLKNLATSLLDFDYPNWISNKKSEGEIFNLLQLNMPDSNPLESLFFTKWTRYVEEQSDAAYQVIFDRLVSHFKNEYALVVALNALDGSNHDGKLEVAKTLLDWQYKKWESEKKNAADVFNNLKPYLPKSNIFSSPAFSAWAGFTKSTSSNQQATETMLSVLEDVYNKDLSRFFAKGTQIKKIEDLQTVWNKKLLTRKSSDSAEPERESPDLDERPSLKRKSFRLIEQPSSESESPDLAERPSPKRKRPDMTDRPSPDPPINLDLNNLSDGERPDLADRPSPKQPNNLDLNNLPDGERPDLAERPSPDPPINLDLNNLPDGERPDLADRSSPKQPNNFDLNEALPEPI